jgi:cyclic lactone autoinducer peptide
MKKLFTRFCNGFLALALLVGSVDVSMMTREVFYQPPVPEALLKKQK